MIGRLSRRELLRRGALAAAALSCAPLEALAFSWRRTPAPEPAQVIARIPSAAIRKFSEGLSGSLILPGSEDYQAARAIYESYQPSDKSPAAIVRCELASDVSDAILFARQYQLPVSIRSGGHDALGASVCDGGMVIDLSGMNRVRVRPNQGAVQADAGMTARELSTAMAPLGLATVMAQCPSVGVSGFTLGGGLGWLSGKYGAACDNLIGAEIVTADGHVVTASREEKPDLFWAVRGGGGNFGIATSFQFQAYPVNAIFGGTLTFPMTKLADFLRFYRSYMSAAPDELDAMVYAPTEDGKYFGVVLCYCGNVEAAKGVLRQRLKQFAKPRLNTVHPRPYAEMYTMPAFTDEVATGTHYSRSGFLKAIDDQTIDAIVSAVWKAPSHMCRITLDHYMHGALCRPSADATAFGVREPGGMTYRIASGWRDASVSDSAIAWVNESWSAFQPLAGGKAYVNYLSTDDPAGVKAAYGANYDRLAAIKKKYDPDNFFRLNRNITPA